ncbi:hypothetical protein AB832_08030 [Flavobacteriaceae bacterium (ex Bugula neritina AB1)]|nr:hypothetical protein AB832_08030 [Flavobacteriaceae bacterium (ex Bugula neritina AB1)]
MKARIIAYNYDKSSGKNCSDFSMNVYWGEGYKNVYYLCGDQGRTTFENITETVLDPTGQTIKTQNSSIPVYIVNTLAISPLMAFLMSIDKHDVKQIEYLETGEVFDITNITIDDQGDILDPMQLVYISYEDKAITKVSDVVYTDDQAKKAYFDNNDNGTPDIDGLAIFQATTPPNYFFVTWQLYFLADGVTPATSGDVIMRVYAESQLSTSNNPIESLVGVFSGQFGDLFSDSTKWQSTQNIWDYFDLTNSVGHTNRVQFDKGAFAEDNGYYSDEIEDRAVKLRFEVSIDGSAFEKTTMELVYTVWGAFNSMGVQSPATSIYGITTIGKDDQKNTLSTISDSRIPLPAGNGVTIQNAVLTSLNNFSNTYTIDTAPGGEHLYEASFTTSGGYVGSVSRGSFSADNFTFAVDPASSVYQAINTLNFATGITPLALIIDWKYDRQTGAGGFPILGDITALGDAEILLNGVVLSNPPIAPATQQVTGSVNVTLPDTGVHTVEFRIPTTTSREIFTKLELQAKPLY